MDIMQLAGITITAGFVTFWAANLITPAGLYSEADTEARLRMIDASPVRWAVSQAGGGLGIAITGLGLVALSLHLKTEHGVWLTYLPAILNSAAVVSASVYLYLYIKEPAPHWQGSEHLSLALVSPLMMAAAIPFGFLFLKMGLPSWLAYLTVGYGIIAIAGILLARPPSFYVVAVYFVILLAVAITLVGQ